MDPPRPLADLPPVDPAELARAWLLRRLAAAPLADAPGLASEPFVAAAPGIVAGVVAALGSAAGLAALTGGAAASHGDPGPGAAVRGAGPGGGVDAAAASGGAAGRGDSAARGGAGPRDVAASRTGLCPAAALVAVVGPEPAAVVRAAEALRSVVAEALTAAVRADERAALHDRLAHACAQLSAAAVSSAAIAVRDVRGRSRALEGGPVDRARLAAEVGRLVREGAAGSVVALEIEDASVLPPGVLAHGDRALRTALPPGAWHVPDGPGSLVVLLGHRGGRALAEALVAAVAAAASHHGAALRVAAGVAELPRDGTTLEALLAHADGQLFAARAEGLPVV